MKPDFKENLLENTLTINEKAELDTLEGIISREMGSFIAVGKALLTIRDRRLYREEFNTFNEYCKEKWGMSKDYAHRLIRGSRWRPIWANPFHKSPIRRRRYLMHSL